ncbi:MAG: MarR family transcriptional regulator [Proteobacteria bacterium]|nr:MarR family transcriptional regulator [Pseudomonadota bacterium]
MRPIGTESLEYHEESSLFSHGAEMKADKKVPAARVQRKSARQAKPLEVKFGCLPDLVGYNLRRAQSAVFQHFADTVSSHDVSPGHFGVLVFIEANPGMSQTMLAGALGVDRSSIVPVIDHLEHGGLVTRQKKPSDRRTHELRLTAYGESRLKALKTSVLEHDEEIARCLSADEKRNLIEALGKIMGRLA